MRIGIDVGGTNTDAVVVDGRNVLAAVKRSTTPNVTDGIVDALRSLVAEAAFAPADVQAVMIGTTHFTNAVVEAKRLVPTAAVRLGLPATEALPPLVDWPDRLRDAIASLYAKQARENVLVCHGTIGANALVHQALVSRGDHVIAGVPTYQQHYSIPESIGAEVELLWLKPEDGHLPDLARLKAMLRPSPSIETPSRPESSLPSTPKADTLMRSMVSAFTS